MKTRTIPSGAQGQSPRPIYRSRIYGATGISSSPLKTPLHRAGSIYRNPGLFVYTADSIVSVRVAALRTPSRATVDKRARA
jgi:hypothetical protein